jgi:uncharacterized protein (TIGR02266 family)
MDETPEKRSDQRVPLILRVEYPGHERVLRDTTENLSAGGLFIRSDRELAIGERIPLQISFPGLLPPLTVEVEVVRCREASPAGPRGLAVRVPLDRPGDRAALAALTEAARGGQGAPAASYRILVVEDNHYVVGMYEYALRKLGGPDGTIELRFAANGHEALESLRQSRPDLLISDLYMPVMDGFTLLERLRADPGLAGVAVLVISAGDEAARERALALGVDVFLRKPVQFADLVGTVSSLLGLRAQRAPRP